MVNKRKIKKELEDLLGENISQDDIDKIAQYVLDTFKTYSIRQRLRWIGL